MSDVIGSALLCSADEQVKEALIRAGYKVTPAATCAEALPRVRHDHWTVIALDRSTGRETLEYLHGLPGIRRRDLFVVAFGDRFETGNKFQAWAESVDLVVHPDDCDQLRRQIADGLREKDEFYLRFRTLQRDAGALLGAHA
ncbi:MAG: hypothetical protein ACYS6Z_18565 [Planctomycetota bacterium]|jgi:DNA-binding response OmpR family regulator